MVIYMYIAPGQGQTTPLGQSYSLTHLFCQFSTLLHVSPLNDFVTVFPIQIYTRLNLTLPQNKSRSTNLRVFFINGRGGHLGHMTMTMFPHIKEAQYEVWR